MNFLAVVGPLTEIAFQQIRGGKTVVTVTVSVQSYQDKRGPVKFESTYDKLVDQVRQNVRKGDIVAVTGKFVPVTYTKDGSDKTFTKNEMAGIEVLHRLSSSPPEPESETDISGASSVPF